MKKNLLFMLTILTLGFAAAPLSAQNTLTVADGTETNNYVPVYGYYADAYLRSQVIYPATDLSDMENYAIMGMTFYLNASPSLTSTFEVKIGTCADATFTDGFLSDAITTVYTGTLPVVNDEMTIVFETPFTYSGGNLLVEVATVSTGNYQQSPFYGITSTGSSVQGYSYSSVSGVSATQRNFIPKTTFSYGVPPACSKPTGLAVSDITTTTATLSWTGDENTSSYNIQYMLSSSTDWDNALTATAYSETYDLTGLQPSSSYKVRVQAVCSDNTETNWTSVVNFMTGCDAITVTEETPWFEDFEGYVGGGERPFVCWATPVTTSVGSPFVYCGHSPSCHSGSNSAEMKGNSGETAVLVLPEFSNDINTLRLTFWATSTSPSYGTLEVGVIPDMDDLTSFELLTETGRPSSRDGVGALMGPFDFNGVTATSGRIALRFTSNSYNLSWNLDDFTVALIPACAEPSGLATGELTSNSANVSWNEVDGTIYDVLYWTDDPSDPEIISGATLTDGFLMISGLNPNTTYSWTVRTDCGDGTYANSFYTLTFTTPNVPVELPYEQDFETNPESITDFTITQTAGNAWIIGTAEFAGDDESGHSLYISNDDSTFAYSYSSYSNQYSYAVLDVEFPEDALEWHLAFDYKSIGYYYSWDMSYGDYFAVYLLDASTPVPTSGLPTGTALLNEATNVTDWTHFDAILEDVAGTAKKIVFLWKNYSYNSADIKLPAAVDNISITGNSCAQPNQLAVSNVDIDAATLSWNEVGSATAWTVYYKAANDDDYTDVTVSGESSYDLTNLNPDTYYSFYVTANCSGEESNPSNTYTFKTACGSISVADNPWTSDFEGSDEDYLNCWVSASTAFRNGNTYPHIEPTSSIAHNSTSALEVAFGDIVTALPAFVEDLSTLELSFWAKNNNYSSSYSNILEVGYITEPMDATTFVPIDTLPKTMTSYTRVVIDFAELANEALPVTTRIAFRFNQENASNLTSWYLDDMMVNLIPTCSAPVYNSVTVGSVTEATAEVSFTDNDESHDAWVIYYRPANSTGDYETENATTTEGTILSGLNPNTTYTVFVKTVCGGVEGENQTDPVTFTTTTVPAQIPFTEDFENEEDMMWIMVNGTQTNKWYVGTPTDPNSDVNTTEDGSRGLYVSNDNGASNTYSYSASRVYAYRDVMVPAGTTELRLSFDWKANGSNQGNEFLRVYWLDPDVVTLTAGNNPPTVNGVNYDAAGQPGNYGAGASEHWLALSTTWQHQEMIISANQFQGMGDEDKVYRLVFHWRNANVYVATNPPAAVDNVVLETVECNAPTNITVTDITESSATVSWEGDANSYLVTVTQGVNSETQEVTGYSIDLTGLNSSTNTVVTLQALCGEDSSVVTSTSFTTSCGAITITETSPWFENFEGYLGSGEQPFVCWETPVVDAQYHGPFVYCGHAPSCHSGANSAEMKGASNLLVLPAFSNDVHDLRLSFWATSTAPSTGTLEVGVMTDPTDPNTFELVANAGTPGPRGNSGSGHGNYMGPFDFNSVQAMGDSVRIALRYTNSSASQSWNLDDFTVQIAPGCPSPVKNSVTATNVDGHNATINFTDTDPDHDSWTVYYREADAADEDPWMEVTTSTTSADLTNLDPETTYDVYVITNCVTPDLVADATNTIQFTTDIACPAPTDLAVTNVGMTSATVTWFSNADSFTIEYGEAGFTPGTGTTFTATSSTYDLSGLTAGTAYTVYVTADCGTDGSSSAASFNFNTTICDIADQCAYTFILRDDYGDGWNNGYLTVQQNGIAVITLTANHHGGGNVASADTVVVNLCDNVSTSLVWTEGSFAYEASFALLDPNGNEIYSTIAMDNYTTYTFTTDCNGTGPVITAPTVETDPATNLTQTSATLNGTVTNPSSVDVAPMGFEWKEASALMYNVQMVTGSVLTYNLSGLVANTTYTYRAFITYNGMTYYGDDVTFTTQGSTPQPTDPTVATNAASAIAQTTATLNATITNPDNVNITAKGFEWKTTTGGTYTQIAGTGTGNTFTTNLTGLTANTGYTFKAFITFNGQTVYGNEMTFTTEEEVVEPCDVPTGLHTTAVENHAISIAWDANANVSSWNVQYRVSNGTWTSAQANTNSYTITDLQGLTTYEIQVQANCGDGNLSEWSASIEAQTTNVGIENFVDNSVSLYPNPANDVVNVQCTMNNVQVEAVEVIDVYGKVVRIVETGHAPSLQTQINVSGLASGMYFVRVTTDAGVVTKSFVKR